MVRIPITDKSSQVAAAAQDRDAAGTMHHYSATATPDKPLSAHGTGDAAAGGSDATAGPHASSGDDASDPTVPPATPGGADVVGGAITAPQDADAAADEQQAQRTGDEDMRRQQESGEVDTQTKDLKPHLAHPEEGLPANPTGRENTGGTTPADETAGGANGNGASAGTVARAAAEHDERFLRLAADFENFKRQAARRENEIREHTTMRVVEDILPVLDNFELAIKSAQNARDIEQVRVGVEYILQQLRTVLKNHGVEPLEAKGQSFDPLQHDALEEVDDSGHPEGTVVDETQRGYSFKGRVLRPSRVRVAGSKK